MSLFSKPKTEPERPIYQPYTGPHGPTVCAQVSHARPDDIAFLPCPACGHQQHYRPRPGLCVLCQFEVRLQALEAQR